jgi:hypothetical protein
MCILPTKGNYMSTIDVLDRNTNKTVKAKIDQEDYDRLKTYKYIIDKNNEKPFREEKVNNQVRRIFLARDVSNFKFGDGRVVRVKNKDITPQYKKKIIASESKKDVLKDKPSQSSLFKDLLRGSTSIFLQLTSSKSIIIKYGYVVLFCFIKFKQLFLALAKR